jgi:hypothetical protein
MSVDKDREMKESEVAGGFAPIIDYVVHQYGLTRDQARELVRQFGGDRALIDAEAGRMKAYRRP